MPALMIASMAISAEANPLFMLLAPRPQTQPSRKIALGLKPSPAKCSSSPEYEVSMWPVNSRLSPSPRPRRCPTAFGRFSSTSGRSVSMPDLRMRSTRYCATPISFPVALGISTRSISKSRTFSAVMCAAALAKSGLVMSAPVRARVVMDAACPHKPYARDREGSLAMRASSDSLGSWVAEDPIS